MNFKEKNNFFITSFPYYSSPVFPKECTLNLNTEIFLRDMLACTSTNEYNHYEYPKFQNFSYDIGCMRDFVPRIIKEYLNNKEVFILFRTSLKAKKESKTYISGYYKISKAYKIETYILGRKRPFIGFYSDEHVFINKENAIEWKIKDVKRGAVYSENEKYCQDLLDQLDHYRSHLKTIHNISIKYQNLTIKWMEKLKSQSYRKKIFKTCNNCSIIKCFLKKRIKFYQKLTNKPDFFYLDYLYNPKVYLTDLIDSLPKKILKKEISEKNVEM